MSATAVESRHHDNTDIKWEDSGIVLGKPRQPGSLPLRSTVHSFSTELLIRLYSMHAIVVTLTYLSAE